MAGLINGLRVARAEDHQTTGPEWTEESNLEIGTEENNSDMRAPGEVYTHLSLTMGQSSIT